MTETSSTPKNFYESNKESLKVFPKEFLKETLTPNERRILTFTRENQEERLIFKSFLQPPQFDQEEQLKNEPKTEMVWMHYSCAFWHGIFYSNGKFTKIDQIYYPNLIGKVCSICSLSEGGCVKCFQEEC